ncbi:MAG: hypothetical protein CMM93_08690 [Rickettsiales bacterium]|nr:hypothetical protein [Rickettsiales bacterium]
MKRKKQLPPKASVIAILKGGDTPQGRFNQLLQKLLAHPEHAPGLAKHYNAAGFSKERLATLEYDVKKTYGVTNRDLISFEPLTDAPKTKTQSSGTNNSNALQTLFDGDIEAMDYHKELKPLATELAAERGDELPDMKGATLSEYLHKVKDEIKVVYVGSAKEAIENAPDNVKGGWKIHDEYPFLDEDDCPGKLKELVSDMVTAHRKYKQSRKELKELGEDDPELMNELTAKAVENFELNKEIKAELDYYKENGEILGNHPIFEEEMLQKKVDGYKEAELGQKRANLKSYISKEGKKLEKAKDADSKAIIEAKVNAFKAELDLVEARIANGKK